MIVKPEPVVLRSTHDVATGEVVGIEVLEAPKLSSITPEALADMDPRYLSANRDVLTLAPDVRYLIGAEHGEHGERLLHRL